MQTKTKLVSATAIASVFALGVALTFTSLASADDKEHKGHGKEHQHHAQMMKMTQIKTQAEAEALKPGDSIAMVCSMCKYVTVHPVGNDKSHIQMMTAGNTHTCSVCGGKVTVKGTGKGQGKHQEVKHVCSKCGDDAMFVVATKSANHATHDEHKHH